MTNPNFQELVMENRRLRARITVLEATQFEKKANIHIEYTELTPDPQQILLRITTEGDMSKLAKTFADAFRDSLPPAARAVRKTAKAAKKVDG